MSSMDSSNSTTKDTRSQFIKPLINDFDLDVVDEALLHPEKQEYIDHFGFKVQVKTDNEYDQDTSESEDEFEDASSPKSSFKTKDTFISQEDYGIIPNTDPDAYTQVNVRGIAIQEELFLPKPEEEEEEEKMNTIEDWQLVSSVEKLGLVNSSSPATPPETSSTTDKVHNNISYYDLLLSKFARSGNQDSIKQAQLKEETSHNLELLKKQSSKGDTDWEFWASVISDFDQVNRTEHSKFRSLLSIGIPSSLRGMLWRIFSNSINSDLVENEYRELLNKTSTHEKLIQRDLPRTFPSLPYFKEKDGEGQQMIFNVIKAYSLFDEQVGYCQGLHFVVGCLVLHMPDEAAFCVLIKLMSHYGLRGHFTPHMETLHERMYQFDQLLCLHLPQVHRHLDAQGVLPSMYASQWFMTLFAYRCPLDLVFRVLDLVFVEGSQIVLNFALALMEKNQQMILSLEFESLLKFFAGSIFDAYKDDPYDFVQDAYRFDIPTRQLMKLSKQYATEAAKEAKIQSIEDGIKRENMQLQEQIKKLRKSYISLEMEHQDVTQQVIDSKMSMASLDSENQQLKRELLIMKIEEAKINSLKGTNGQDQFDELAHHNAKLVAINSTLEDRLQEVETELIHMKLKYAESQNDYEMMKQSLFQNKR